MNAPELHKHLQAERNKARFTDHEIFHCVIGGDTDGLLNQYAIVLLRIQELEDLKESAETTRKHLIQQLISDPTYPVSNRREAEDYIRKQLRTKQRQERKIRERREISQLYKRAEAEV